MRTYRPLLDEASMPDVANCGINVPSPDMLTPERSVSQRIFASCHLRADGNFYIDSGMCIMSLATGRHIAAFLTAPMPSATQVSIMDLVLGAGAPFRPLVGGGHAGAAAGAAGCAAGWSGCTAAVGAAHPPQRRSRGQPELPSSQWRFSKHAH